MSRLEIARTQFHEALLQDTLLLPEKMVKGKAFPSPTNADGNNTASRKIATEMLKLLNGGELPLVGSNVPDGQTAGDRFEKHVAHFVEQSFLLFSHLRPGKWDVMLISSRRQDALADFEQYSHLADLSAILDEHRKLKSMLGTGHLICPDIALVRYPETDEQINSPRGNPIVDSVVAIRTPLRKANQELPILHASISCKFTIRSDRAQNSRTEALNLLRNRKGRAPHIVVVTAEPLPSRLSSIALGTGDVDCVYHVALPELQQAVEECRQSEAKDLLEMMIEGKRIRDISDLPLDLAI